MPEGFARRRLAGLASAIGVAALLLLFMIFQPASAQEDAEVEITSPRDGAVLTGVVEIRGTLDTASFLSADLEFAYVDDSSDQWFEIAQPPNPATDAQLAVWDTTAISDGAYRLRLRLLGTNGTVRDAVIGVQVRNYTATPIPTASAAPTHPLVFEVATPIFVGGTPTEPRLPAATPTHLQPNPVGLTRPDVLAMFARGGLAVIAVFLLWGAVTFRRRA